MKSKTQIEKELDREYKKAQPVGFLLAGTLLGLIGGIVGNAAYDAFIKPNHYSVLTIVVVGGTGFIFAFWYINHLAYEKINRLEKELKKFKKK